MVTVPWSQQSFNYLGMEKDEKASQVLAHSPHPTPYLISACLKPLVVCLHSKWLGSQKLEEPFSAEAESGALCCLCNHSKAEAEFLLFSANIYSDSHTALWGLE